MRVLICDDELKNCKEAETAVKAGAPKSIECKTVCGEPLQHALQALFAGVQRVLDGDGRSVRSAFDHHDIIILDNNLSHLNFSGARLTAESIAGYIRAFSSTPYILSLNKNPDVDFDLRYLVGDYATRADLAINAVHLRNKALWSGKLADAYRGFRPWYWPALQDAAARRKKQIAFVERRLDKQILSSFGFPELAIELLSRHAAGTLSPFASLDKGQIEKVTFRELFETSGRSFPAKSDRDELLKKKLDRPIARMVAADLDLWFRRDIIGPQDVLVDAPHLVMRMPFLLGRRAADLNGWAQTAEAATEPFGCSPTLFKRHMKRRYRFAHDAWCAQPSFWWPSINADENLRKLFYSEEQPKWGDFVFCEDVSTFTTRSGQSTPHEFVAEFDSPWNRRYVRRLSGFKYAPLSRFAI